MPCVCGDGGMLASIVAWPFRDFLGGGNGGMVASVGSDYQEIWYRHLYVERPHNVFPWLFFGRRGPRSRDGPDAAKGDSSLGKIFLKPGQAGAGSLEFLISDGRPFQKGSPLAVVGHWAGRALRPRGALRAIERYLS